MVPVDVKTSWYGLEAWNVPAVSATAARAKDGDLYVALANVDPNQPATVTTALAGSAATTVSGRILNAPAMQSLNDFAHPDVVKPAAFDGARIANGSLVATLPPHSIVVLRLH